MALSKEGPLSRAEKIKKAAPAQKKSNCIAAIDFGTSSLSVAYTTPRTGGDVKVVPLHSTLERIPNAILMLKDDEDYEVIALGHQAQNLYCDVEKGAKTYVYFERIKKSLEKDKTLDRTTEVPSFTGGSYYLIEVIAFILKHLKEKLLIDHLKGNNKSSDFDWVITVPAIWKARARRMMREAAYMAGLTSDAPGIPKFTPVGSPLPHPEEVNPEKLSLALEPEVAAIAAQHQSAVSGKHPPQRYMVVDIGGGTVDITVHDKSNGRISVVLPPMGNNWGGTTVNEAFSELLQKIVQDKGFDSFITSDPVEANAVLNKLNYGEFEEKKKNFGKNTRGDEKIVLTLPHFLISFYCNDKLQIADTMNMQYDPAKGTLSIGYDLLEEKTFKVTVDKIIECVEAALDEVKSDGIDTVYLVGGFGGCIFLYQKIEEAIAQHRGILYDNIVCPEQPDLAVVSGAVMWRKDPNIIQSRVADATYGVGVAPVFDPSIHDEHYKIVDEDGVQRCDKVFKVFILKGEVIKDQVYKATLVPSLKEKTKSRIRILSTTNDGVQYVEDKEGKPTVRKIGELLLDTPNPGKKDRKYSVFMDFSGTEIQAKAQYGITRKEVKTVCDFLSNQDDQQ